MENKDKIKEIIAKVLNIPVSDLIEDRPIVEFEIDSVDMAEILFNIEDNFDIDVDTTDFFNEWSETKNKNKLLLKNLLDKLLQQINPV